MSDFERQECAKCPYLIYKGDDEMYCRICGWREFTLQRWQRYPKWCPVNRRRKEEARKKAEQDG